MDGHSWRQPKLAQPERTIPTHYHHRDLANPHIRIHPSRLGCLLNSQRPHQGSGDRLHRGTTGARLRYRMKGDHPREGALQMKTEDLHHVDRQRQKVNREIDARHPFAALPRKDARVTYLDQHHQRYLRLLWAQTDNGAQDQDQDQGQDLDQDPLWSKLCAHPQVENKWTCALPQVANRWPCAHRPVESKWICDRLRVGSKCGRLGRELHLHLRHA